MITSINIPSIAQTLVEARKLGLMAVSSSLNGLGEASAAPGQLLPLLIAGAVHTVKPARWGIFEFDQQPILYCNVDSQLYGHRGIIIAHHIEIETADSHRTRSAKISDPTGRPLKIGAVLIAAGPRAPLSCAILLRQSDGASSASSGLQPLLLHDHQCQEFLAQQSDATRLHEIEPSHPFRIEPGEE